MITMKSKLTVADNSGALLVECIKVLRKKKNIGCVGDIIIVAVKKAYFKKKVKKHDVQRAIIVRTKKPILRKQIGSSLYFNKNAAVIIDKKNNPLGNRIKGSMCKELREKKFMKLISLASTIV
jgi:large subunit ribosomal protein L14